MSNGYKAHLDLSGTLKARSYKKRQDAIRMARRQAVVKRIYLQHTTTGRRATAMCIRQVMIEGGMQPWSDDTIGRDINVVKAQLVEQGRCPTCGQVMYPYP